MRRKHGLIQFFGVIFHLFLTPGTECVMIKRKGLVIPEKALGRFL